MPFQIVRSDIIKMKVDAIVNTANPKPVCAGGTDSAIYEAAGAKLLLTERKKIGKMKAGQAAVTPAFHLDAQYIIHTVGPVWKGGWHGEARTLRACYDNSLDLALQYHCNSIAFPLISTGVYGFPKEKALQIAMAAVNEFLMEHEMQVYLVVFDQKSFRLSGKLFREIDTFIDENYVRKQIEKEYVSRNILRQSDEEEDTWRDITGAMPSLPENILYESMQEPEEIFCAPAPRNQGNVPCKSAPRNQENIPCAFAGSARSLEDVINNVGETFQERLLRFIDERDMTNAQVYKKANLSRKLFSKILCNPDYQPKKRTVIAFAIALQLNLDDTKDLMARAGFALSPGSRFDLVIAYFIEKKVYDIYTINVALFDHDLPMLGE